MNKVVVIGAGAAGMIASVFAAEAGSLVTLIDKNEKTGKKLYITGKGRCNVTNACDDEDFFKNVVNNPKFLYSAYYGFNNLSLMELIEQAGCKLKEERGNRVFPASDHSSDILATFNRLLAKHNVEVLLNTTVTSVKPGSVFTNKGRIDADSIIIATGGASYTSTGSTGDGYKFAESLGHTVIEPKGALVPLVTKEGDAKDMQGLSLKNVKILLESGGKKVYSDFGEMLFTHFGVSGPVILSASSYYAKSAYGKEAVLHIDLKPALDEKTLDERILRDFDEAKNKAFKNSLDKLLPKLMIPVVIKRSKIDEDKKVNEITREERLLIGKIIKDLTFTVTGASSINEAIITSGGVNIKEINPSTMESKITPGIYFAGEVMDVDALTGGFNLQIAWSTGALAGMSAAKGDIS